MAPARSGSASPLSAAPARRWPPIGRPRHLAEDFAARLSSAPVQFALHVQEYVSEWLTPAEDGAMEWKESDSPSLLVAMLTIPVQNLLDLACQSARDRVDALAFSPWHAPAEFRPLGNLNRARHPVYAASARGWQIDAAKPTEAASACRLPGSGPPDAMA